MPGCRQHAFRTLMFLVVGRRPAARNYSLNGYQKETNGFTEKEAGSRLPSPLSATAQRSCAPHVLQPHAP